MKNIANGGDFLIGLNFLARILQSPPDVPFLLQCAAMPPEIFAWPGVPEKSAQALRDALCRNYEENADRLSEEHTRLFTGPFPVVPLWESVWREKDKLLFGQSTREMENLFADWQLANDDPDKIPLDHLGYELALLAYLLETAEENPLAASLQGKNPADAAANLLHGHIMAFAPQVLASIINASSVPFYSILAENSLKMLSVLSS